MGPIESWPEVITMYAIVAAEQTIATKNLFELHSHHASVDFSSGNIAMAPKMPMKGMIPMYQYAGMWDSWEACGL